MDLDLQVRAYVDRARAQADPRAWLTTLRDQAMDAVTAGDVEVNVLGFEGGSATGARKFNAQMLLEVTQHALERLRGDDQAQVVTHDYATLGRIVST